MERGVGRAFGRTEAFPDATIIAANNLVQSLMIQRMDALREGDAMSSEVSPESVSAVDEARALLVKTIPASQRTLGPDHEYTLGLQSKYGLTFTVVDEVSRDDLAEGAVMLEDIIRKARRIFGVAHPQTKHFQSTLAAIRFKLDGNVEALRAAPAAKGINFNR